MKSRNATPYKTSRKRALQLARGSSVVDFLPATSPKPSGFDSFYTFAGNWSDSEFVVKRNPALMNYLKVSDWLKRPHWAKQANIVLINAIAGISLVVLSHRVATTMPWGILFEILAPFVVTSLALLLINIWLGRVIWKQAMVAARPALEWRAANADAVRFVGNLPAIESEQLAQIRKTPGIGHPDIWECSLLLEEKAPLTSFISEYSRFHTPHTTNNELLDALGQKLTAARSRIQQIDQEIQAKTAHTAAIHAALYIDITDEERAARAARRPYDS